MISGRSFGFPPLLAALVLAAATPRRICESTTASVSWRV
eukprot:CAMPEP_0174761050 /NCGR_PEP_ID=MMETSP1094-20130205/109082_1 /TAXON_ID=156173 /ORGANISM="Chrysochromulina brevifilum, Strain UTEX LB 985" /LENGTH=38 /DNA_ID= /DNA_START= /DNA_END= /DNA_ORIENTATION=